MKKIGNILKIVITIVLVSCVVVMGILYGFLRKIDRVDPEPQYTYQNAPITRLETLPSTKAKNTTPLDDSFHDNQPVNIMLIGRDNRDPNDHGRSDTMILATVNTEDRTIKLTSFMRDLYVQIPGHKDNRLNLAYQLGGMRLLQETIEKNFQISVDGNIEVDFEAFEKTIDIIGGIDVELNPAEARYLGYEKAGISPMDGRKALIYARLREVGNCDFERTERQRKVLSAAFEKVKKTNLGKVMDLLNTCLPLVTTDMTDREIIRLAVKVLSADYGKPQTFRIPVDGGYKEEIIRGMEVLEPDLDKNRKALQENLYPTK